MKEKIIISIFGAAGIAAVACIVYWNVDCRAQGGTLYRNLFGAYECLKVERVFE